MDARKVFDALDTYDADTKKRLNKAVNSSLNAIRRGAKSRVHSVTGNLVKGIKKTFDERVTSGTVRSKAFHAHLIEFGTKPVKGPGSKAKAISTNPVRARTLRNGKPIPMPIPGVGPRASYWHKGIAKRPYMQPAFEDERPKYIRKIEKAVQPGRGTS